MCCGGLLRRGFAGFTCLAFSFPQTTRDRKLGVYSEYLCNSDWFWDKSELKLLVSISKEICIVLYETNYLEIPHWKAYTMGTRFCDFLSRLWFQQSDSRCISLAQ